MAGNPLTAPEDFVNAALGRLGYRRRIGLIWEGSEASKLALDVYGQTRDFLLRDKDYDFAQKEAALTIAGVAPSGPWAFRYLFPNDCIRIRDLYGSAYLADTNDPLPNLYQREVVLIGGVFTDTILADAAGATLVYTGRITNPSLWDEGFGEALIDALARRLAPSLASPDVQKMVEATEAATIATASEIEG